MGLVVGENSFHTQLFGICFGNNVVDPLDVVDFRAMFVPEPPSFYRRILLQALRWRIILRLFHWPVLNRPFHWKISGVLIPFFYGMAVAMVQLDRFELAHLFVAAGFLWTIGLWLTSRFLSDRRRMIRQRSVARSTQRSRTAKRNLLAWYLVVSVLIALFNFGWWRFVDSERLRRELLAFEGRLYPASDPDPLTPCRNVRSDQVVLVYGTPA